MKKEVILLLMLCLFMRLFPANASANAAQPDRRSALSVGGSGVFSGDTSGHAEEVRYERRIVHLLTGYAVLGNMEYRHESGSYVETGRGPGAEIGLLFYPLGALEAWYVGMAWEAWKLTGKWQDDVGTPFVTGGSIRTTARCFGLLVTGYKWFPGSRDWFVDPRLQLGDLTDNVASKAFNGPSFFVGVHVGITW